MAASGQRSRGARWIAIIHQLPPTPGYLRVKVRRRLHKLGAYALKQTVYLLPNTAEALEDFQWLRQEIESDGGSAVVAEIDFIEGVSDEEIAAWIAGAEPGEREASAPVPPRETVAGGTWVTREDVHVDRIASAWLIRRFIDPGAKLKFVAARGYRARPGELRFDMSEAEFTHVGSDCTFQTLVRHFRLRDAALHNIGEIVHDIDCKDDLYGRPETAGVARVFRGIIRDVAKDSARIARGSAFLDDLHAGFSRS